MSEETNWSDWLDFSSEQVSKIPESPGVFMMHAKMKILYIGNTINLQQTITGLLSASCINTAKRFRYATTESHESLKNTLLKEYQEKHQGSLPGCM